MVRETECVQCDAPFATCVLGIHGGHCPTCSALGCMSHLFSLLGRRQPGAGAPRQSDVSTGVLLPPLQCWQAHCKCICSTQSGNMNMVAMVTSLPGRDSCFTCLSVCHANMCYPTEGDTTTCYLGNTWAHCYQCKGLFSHYHCSHVHTYATVTHCGVWLCFPLSAEKTAALSEGTCSTFCCQTEEVRMFTESFVQKGSWNGLWGVSL